MEEADIDYVFSSLEDALRYAQIPMREKNQ